MQKPLLILIGLIILAVAGFYALNNYIYNEKQADETQSTNQEITTMDGSIPAITPISHATMVLEWEGKIIYTDPVGNGQSFVGQPEPDLILITDEHGDHFDPETLRAVTTDRVTIIAPQVVADQLEADLPGTVVVMSNGETITLKGFEITAVPMYNIPEAEDAYHVKGRGNGYVLNGTKQRVYIAGDTSNTPEMRALQNIDLAFVPMNLPFTMSVDEAAQAVLAFAPAKVVPYHYRGQDGLANTNRFRELVNTGNPEIQVDLIDFYPQQ